MGWASPLRQRLLGLSDWQMRHDVSVSSRGGSAIPPQEGTGDKVDCQPNACFTLMADSAWQEKWIALVQCGEASGPHRNVERGNGAQGKGKEQ